MLKTIIKHEKRGVLSLAQTNDPIDVTTYLFRPSSLTGVLYAHYPSFEVYEITVSYNEITICVKDRGSK